MLATSSLAASLAILASSNGPSDLTERELIAWNRLRPAIAVLLQNGNAKGTAALIDANGLFIAHKNSLPGNQCDARLASGRIVRMKLVATDDPTQFVLLQAAEWEDSGVRPVKVGDDARSGSPLLALLPTGPIRAMIADSGRIGVLNNPSRRFMPLNEVQFEAPLDQIGGALVFSLDGKFLGALNAALATNPATQQSQGRGLTGGVTKVIQDGQAFGPSGLTTAYSVGPTILKRVMEGFLSPSREVIHPSLGVICRDSPDGGALIDSVREGSAADKAGLKKGDVILDINGYAIKDQFDFAKVMLNMDYEQKVVIRARRKNQQMIVDMRVGK